MRLPPSLHFAGLSRRFFRHESWTGPETETILAEGGAALCIADTDDEPVDAFPATAPWGYLRLRRGSYSEDDLRRWLDRIRAQSWSDAFVFFKHEDEARGPDFAARLHALAEDSLAGSPSPRAGGE